MFKSRILLLAVSCWLGALTLQAQTNSYILLNGQKVHPTRILAKFSGQVSAQSTASAMSLAGMRVHRQFSHVPGLVSLDVANVSSSSLSDPAAAAAQLSDRLAALKNSGVFEWVEPDFVKTKSLTPLDTRFVDGTLWGLRNQGQSNGVAGIDIGVTNAWDITTGRTNVIVAVIDSGIRYTHADLAQQMWRNPNEINGNGLDDDNNGFIDDIFGINTVFGTGDPFDDDGHGTHVAGTIGAAANDGNPHVGVTFRVRLMACKFLDSFGSGFGSDEITCINFAIAKGARIINASFGSSQFSQAEFNAINSARNAGILFVAAAGNFGIDNDANEVYPSNYQIDNIISVAAIDRRGQLANFSDFGLTKVHLAAPGVEIFSTVNTSDNAYAVFNGTSMAAPHVSGVAALIRSAFTNATLAEVRQRILKGVTPLASLSGKTITGGMVNAGASLNLAQDGLLEIGINPAPGSLLLQNVTIPFTVTVTDLLPVTNATVTASMPGVFTNRVFANNGVSPDAIANDEVYTANGTIPSSVSGTVALTLTVSAPGKASSITTYNYTIVTSPSNDNFSAAFKIPVVGGVMTGTNTFASIEPLEPVHAGVSTVASSVWWDWAPTTSGQTLVDMSGSTFDTVVGIYTNNSLSTLVEIASLNDLGQNQQGYVFFNAVAGATYHIAVAGATTNETGQIRMRVETGGQPDTTAPGVQINSPTSGTIVTNASLLVSGTANDFPQSGSGVKNVQVKLNGGLPNIANGTNNWSTTVFLQEGTNIIQAVATDFAGNVSAVSSITVTLRIFDPPNDFFFMAIPLSGTSGTSSNNTSKATKEVGEPAHAGNNGGHSIWYTFVAPTNGVLFLNTSNSTFDTLLAVYSGTRVNQLTQLGANDDAAAGVTYSGLSLGVQANQTNYIAIDGVTGANGSGPAILHYRFTNIPIYSVVITNTSGGTVSSGSASYASGTALQMTATPSLGFDFVTWQGSVISQANPLSLVVGGNLSFGAIFLPHLVSDNFETGNLTKLKWTPSGSVGWSVQITNVTETNTILGKTYFARSGVIGNNQTSTLSLSATNITGTGAFAYRVSCEDGFDFLDFYVNTNRLLHVSSSASASGWTNFSFSVPAGSNSFHWHYIKDQSRGENLDAAFIDNVDLPLVVPKNGTTPALFNFISQTGTNVEFRIFGQTNQLYLLQVSSDLSNWETISTNVAVHGIIQFLDTNAVSTATRFYRAISP